MGKEGNQLTLRHRVSLRLSSKDMKALRQATKAAQQKTLSEFIRTLITDHVRKEDAQKRNEL
jgi:uncharacterized protein (DUF1778 family)